LVQMAADGSGAEHTVFLSEHDIPGGSWSPDGQHFAFTEIHPDTSSDIWVWSVKDRKRDAFVRTRFAETECEFSPNGRWIAYTSNESGGPEVYVRAFPGPAGKWQVSTGGGTNPIWSPDGRELFYRAGSRLMAAPLEDVGA